MAQDRATDAQKAEISRWVSETVANAPQRNVDRLLARIAREPVTALTDEEFQALAYAMHGYTLAETAATVYRSTGAVEDRRRRILRKLGARNMAHAAYLWLTRS